MSFYTALTGLNAASTDLSVTSNNIANANTTSFKRSDANFGDIFASSALLNPSTVQGGGVALTSIQQEFTQGNLELSANALDIAITGDGFFPLASQDGSELYSRKGVFSLSETDQVVNTEGHTLQVHPIGTSGASNFNQAMIPLTVPRVLGATPTSAITLDIQLPDNTQVVGGSVFDIAAPTSAITGSLIVTDGTTTVTVPPATYGTLAEQVAAIQGEAGYVDLLFTIDLNDAGTGIEFNYKEPGVVVTTPTLSQDGGVVTLTSTNPTVGSDVAIDPSNNATFNASQVLSLYDDAGEAFTATVYYQKVGNDVVVGATTEDKWRAAVYINGDLAEIDGDNEDGATDILAFNFDSTSGDITGLIGNTTIAPSSLSGRSNPITLTLNALMHTKDFEIVTQDQNGLPQGDLVDINVGNDGLVVATYSNGEQNTAGRINLANFTSAQGLRQQGSTTYTTTGESGKLSFGEPGSNGYGVLTGGAKERSNVDLTEELVNLIAAQRNFQSNAKALETSSALTQTMLNIRG
jgi:flagellar hook protein FlgE|tara:strand:+ start:1796 stop:3361 length:1566 start_codon:yes stop_codon:yes gene_type:complete